MLPSVSFVTATEVALLVALAVRDTVPAAEAAETEPCSSSTSWTSPTPGTTTARPPRVPAPGAVDSCGPLAYKPVTDRLFHHRGDGTFEDVTAAAGLLGPPGNRLGAVAADFDGDEDLFRVHLSRETNTLYLNDGNGLFRDRTTETGLGPASLAVTSFGVGLFDQDNDGDLDGDVDTLLADNAGPARLLVCSSAATPGAATGSVYV